MNQVAIIASSKLQINHPITIKQLMSISQLAKNYDGAIKILRKQQEIDARHVAKLTAFFLTLGTNANIKLIVSGPDVDNTIQKIKTICSSTKDRQQAIPSTVQFS